MKTTLILLLCATVFLWGCKNIENKSNFTSVNWLDCPNKKLIYWEWYIKKDQFWNDMTVRNYWYECNNR